MKSEPTQKPVLSTVNLSIGYSRKKDTPVRLCKDLNLHLNAGELTCLIGRNGIGKSTLIRTLATLQAPLEGKVLWGNQQPELLSPRARAREAAIVLTSLENMGSMRAEELVALGRYPHTDWQGRLSSIDKAVVDRVLEETGSSAYRSQMITTLSDGQKQRLLIARALAQETRLLFLDEPTAFLDLPGRASTLLLLRKIAHEKGMGILLSTHDLSLSLEVADHIWLIENTDSFYQGSPTQLIQEGTLERVFVHDGIYFDSQSGSLKISKTHKKN